VNIPANSEIGVEDFAPFRGCSVVVGPQADRSDSENGPQKDRSENEMLEHP